MNKGAKLQLILSIIFSAIAAPLLFFIYHEHGILFSIAALFSLLLIFMVGVVFGVFRKLEQTRKK